MGYLKAYALVNWFNIFLNYISQKILINSMLSDPLTMYSGVPQGCVTGPLLF